MNDAELTQRMRAASEAIEMSDAAQARHLEKISAALAAAGDTSDGDVVPLSAAGVGRRRRVVASVVAAAMITPAGLAAASEGSVPGDALYPVKQLSERVLVLFDADVIARHRIEEIEALETAGRFDPELYEHAHEALAELGDDHPLWERLATPAEAGDDADDVPDVVVADDVADDDDRSEFEQGETTTLELLLPDGKKATVTIAGGELVDVDPPDGWTVEYLDDDEATLTTGEFEVEVHVLANGSLDTEIKDQRKDTVDDDTSSSEDDSNADDSEDDDDESEDTGVEPFTPSGEEPDDDAGPENGDGLADDSEDDDEPSEDD